MCICIDMYMYVYSSSIDTEKKYLMKQNYDTALLWANTSVVMLMIFKYIMKHYALESLLADEESSQLFALYV